MLELEVIVSSIEDAIEAARGGAHRLEVVRDLACGGLTPSIDLIRRIQHEVALPLRVMVRESDGFRCASVDERGALVDRAAACNALGVDGIVVGWIRDGRIDEETLAAVLNAAPSLRATFHRALDALANPEAAFHVLRRYPQIDRVLTSAGAGPWAERCPTLRRYARCAGPPIAILPGGGVDEDALRAIARCGCVSEAHVGRAARVRSALEEPVSAALVSTLCAAAGSRP